VIGLFVWDEWQYDKNIPGGENVYRVYEQRKDNNNITYAAISAPAFATFLNELILKLITTTRILCRSINF
jgi:putative ABC transport system permease protein